MIRVTTLRDQQVVWKRAGLQRPAPTNKASLKLALRELDLPPSSKPDMVVLP